MSDWNLEEALKAMSQQVERAMEQLDLDELAETIGVEAERAREWMQNAGAWLRSQAEQAQSGTGQAPPWQRREDPRGADPRGEDPRRDDPRREDPRRDDPRREDPRREDHRREEQRRSDAAFPSVAPHPLDLPTAEQGVALAALDSGRWSVEPGTDALSVHGQGPGPSDALGLVRELRVRDWLDGDAELTLAGRHALARWLESSAS